MKELYLDMTSGISGDMSIAVLISLGADSRLLSDALSALIDCDVKISLVDTYRSSIATKMLDIKTDDKSRDFRHFKDILKMIDKSTLSDNIKLSSIKTFEILASAEAILHGVNIEDVHFHEIGAVDTIIDIVGFHLAKDYLKIDKLSSSYPLLGSGSISTEHGILPLPAPATLKILEGINIIKTATIGELTTPTGAAILKSSVDEFKSSYAGTVIKDSYVTGNYTFEGLPNLLRAVLLDTDESRIYNDKIILIESNIDDMSGEAFGDLLNRLITAGALDVSYLPIFTKKNRPAYKLSVMSSHDNKDQIIHTIFKYSTTIGLRIEDIHRIVMDRKIIDVNYLCNTIHVKMSSFKDIIKYAPEWQDCVLVSERLQITPIEVYNEVMLIVKNINK